MAVETQQTNATDKSPILAGLLSWFIPGVGHLYAGISPRGIYWILALIGYYIIAFTGFFFVFGIIMFFMAPLLHIAAGVDAYFQTKS